MAFVIANDPGARTDQDANLLTFRQGKAVLPNLKPIESVFQCGALIRRRTGSFDAHTALGRKSEIGCRYSAGAEVPANLFDQLNLVALNPVLAATELEDLVSLAILRVRSEKSLLAKPLAPGGVFNLGGS